MSVAFTADTSTCQADTKGGHRRTVRRTPHPDIGHPDMDNAQVIRHVRPRMSAWFVRDVRPGERWMSGLNVRG